MSRSDSLRWTSVGCLSLLCLGLSATAAAQVRAERISLELIDPVREQVVRIEPGVTALHLVFLATWCSPCLDELRTLSEIEARWGERGYRLVLVAVPTRQTRERLVRFAAERALPGELLFDVDGAAQKLLGAEQLPTHVILDASGSEVLRVGAVEERVEETVARLLSEERVPGRRR